MSRGSKMKIDKCLIGIIGIAFILGLIFALYYQGIIIFNPSSFTHTVSTSKPIAKQQVNLFFWRRDAWAHEKIELIINTEDVSDAILRIANSWLALLDEENIMNKKVTASMILVSASGNEVYISFDRYPFNKESSVYNKWMWVEGLLKTLRENGITIPRIYFKVQHKLLRDYHLDFSSPWPLNGFIKTH